MATSLLTLGTRAMTANYAALSTIGHNISNANTEGYSRQRVEFATADGQFTGAGFFGRGVDVASVTRSHDAFLTREAIATRSVAAGDEARRSQLAMLEGLFATGEAGLGQAAGNLLNAFVDVANKPDDLSARQVVLSRADELATRFGDASQQLHDLQTGVSQDITNSVASVNVLARQIAAVNDQIASSRGTGQPPNDLLDERDVLIGKMAELVQVSTVTADDGSVNVFIGGGQRIVLGSQASELTVQPDQFDSRRTQVALVEGGSRRILADDSLGGGSISGLLRFQGKDLVDARNLLGQMATSIATRMNEQQALGLDLRQPAGSGAPMFELGAPSVLPASTNATGGGGFLASPTITITDATLLQASDYELRGDPAGGAGAYRLTRLSDGQVTSVVDGDEVDGMRIDIGTPAPAALDRFLLRPVAGAIDNIARVLDDPRGIAAASPVTATLGSSNSGTATIGSVAVTDPAHDETLSAAFTFTSASGDYDWELRDAANVVTSSGSGTWTPGEPIVLNGFELRLNGVPADGDAIRVGRTAFPAANNGNALAMVALRDEAMVGRRLNTDGSVFGGESITNAYASAIAEIGVRVQGSASAAAISRSVADSAEKIRADKSGVNLDEEAARLIQFQQAYQAAAKVLQVAQSIFDTMLSATTG